MVWNLWDMEKGVYVFTTEILTIYHIAIYTNHFISDILSQWSITARIHLFLKLFFLILAVAFWDLVKRPGITVLKFLKPAAGRAEKKKNNQTTLVCSKLLVYSESRPLVRNCILLHLFCVCGREWMRNAPSTDGMCSFAVQKSLS